MAEYTAENTSAGPRNPHWDSAQFDIEFGSCRNIHFGPPPGSYGLGEAKVDSKMRPSNSSIFRKIVLHAQAGFGSIRGCSVFVLHVADAALGFPPDSGLAHFWQVLFNRMRSSVHIEKIRNWVRRRRQGVDAFRVDAENAAIQQPGGRCS